MSTRLRKRQAAASTKSPPLIEMHGFRQKHDTNENIEEEESENVLRNSSHHSIDSNVWVPLKAGI
jgi:hypothetical protein